MHHRYYELRWLEVSVVEKSVIERWPYQEQQYGLIGTLTIIMFLFSPVYILVVCPMRLLTPFCSGNAPCIPIAPLRDFYYFYDTQFVLSARWGFSPVPIPMLSCDAVSHICSPTAIGSNKNDHCHRSALREENKQRQKNKSREYFIDLSVSCVLIFQRKDL